MMKIATWYLESVRRLGSARKTAFYDAIKEQDADVWILTETWITTYLEPITGYVVAAQSSQAKDLGLRLDVAPWRRFNLLVVFIAGLLRRGDLLAAALTKPFAPVRPPAPFLLAGAGHPLVGGEGFLAVIHPIVAPILRRRIDRAGDMAAGGQREACRAAEDVA